MNEVVWALVFSLTTLDVSQEPPEAGIFDTGLRFETAAECWDVYAKSRDFCKTDDNSIELAICRGRLSKEFEAKCQIVPPGD